MGFHSGLPSLPLITSKNASTKIRVERRVYPMGFDKAGFIRNKTYFNLPYFAFL